MVRPGMRFSLQSQYAICGVFDIAYNGNGASVQVRVIGERQGIPGRYLEQIFQRLRRAELVRAKRGPGGGYRLARAAEEIHLLDVLEAVEDRLRPFSEIGEGEAAESAVAAGALHRPDFLWPELSRELGRVLAATSIADLCRDAARRGVKRASLEGYEYQI